jgi:tetrahydromethanopterin S-methyltransferase subunit A
LNDFDAQVKQIDLSGETDIVSIKSQVRVLSEGEPHPISTGLVLRDSDIRSEFVPILPGGRHKPFDHDPCGYFVITVDLEVKEIILHHHLPDNTPAHEMKGRSAEAMVLGLIREGLVSELSHAAYLGAELARAETALRFGLSYEQDQPLRGR